MVGGLHAGATALPYGVTVTPVEPGTVIKQGDEEFVVDENHAVKKGSTVYVTPTMYEKLKTSPDIKDAPSRM